MQLGAFSTAGCPQFSWLNCTVCSRVSAPTSVAMMLLSLTAGSLVAVFCRVTTMYFLSHPLVMAFWLPPKITQRGLSIRCCKLYTSFPSAGLCTHTSFLLKIEALSHEITIGQKYPKLPLPKEKKKKKKKSRKRCPGQIALSSSIRFNRWITSSAQRTYVGSPQDYLMS